ncbi:conjugal transfer protein TraG N-terminal domain-containing protein [Burkholderia glumae]|uniref:conjugal transfer protein TraG N-terminal domain-containing protein n=1 Tax=Burkholderia glumae TaxID=337 RepID=UPI003B9C55DE
MCGSLRLQARAERNQSARRTATARRTRSVLIRIQDAEQAAEQMYGSEMFPEIADPSAARADFVNAIGDSYGVILQSSQNASSALRQAMFNNLWRQAGAELPAMLNDPARVDEVNALLSSAQAAVAANGSMQTVGILAQRTLPTVRNYIEARVNYAYATCTTDRGSAAWHTYLITAREHAMALGRMRALDPADLCECPPLLSDVPMLRTAFDQAVAGVRQPYPDVAPAAANDPTPHPLESSR